MHKIEDWKQQILHFGYTLHFLISGDLACYWSGD